MVDKDIAQQFQDASVHFKKGELNEAAILLENIIGYAPHSIPALNLYGITLARLGNFILATKQFAEIINVQPGDIPAYENLARSYMKLQEFQKAKDIYEQLIEITANSYNAYFGLAGSLMSLNNYEESLKMFLKAESLNSSEPQLYVNMGTVHSQLGKDEDAINNYNNAISLQPESIQANLRLGQLLLKNNKTVEAESFLSKVNKIQPENFEIMLSLADAYQKNSKQKEALTLYFKADQLIHKSQNIYTKLDKLILHNGEKEKQKILGTLSKEHIYQDWTEAIGYSKELFKKTVYFDEPALQALQLFVSNYDPSILYSRNWWQKQINSFGDAKFGHDKILRGIHSAVFSWSLPAKETLAQIADFVNTDRLYSYGAGSALWERLLIDYFSIDVIATDFEPRHSFLPIEKVDYSTAVISDADVIFLSWVIRGDQGVFNLLKQMNKDQKLVLVGEPPDEYGVPRICATPEMFTLLEKEFRLVQSIPIVSFSMLNDTACLYVKK